MRSEPATIYSILDDYLEDLVRPEAHEAPPDAGYWDRRAPSPVHVGAIAALGAASVAALLFATLGLLVRL